MSIVITYPFANPVNYSANNAEVVGGVGKLSLVPKAAQTFTQSFDSQTGFTFDPIKTEFVGSLMRQKDRTAASSIFGGSFASSMNLNWHKSGSVTATLRNTPTLVGGKIVCTGDQGVKWAYTSAAIESHKFKYTPNYSTSPPANINIFSTYNGTNNNGAFYLTNSPSGNNLRLTLYNNVGAVVISVATALVGWSPTASQEYEFEVILDSVAGTVRVFVDGVLLGTATPGTWARGGLSTFGVLGSSAGVYSRGEGSFDDYVYFNNAQHTVTYTPGYSVAPTIYGLDSIDIPNFTYAGLGAIQSLNSLAITEVGAPKYVVEDQWWTGSAWAASNGTYAEANTLATINANIGTLNALGETVISFKVVWTDTNTQASVDAMTLTYTGQEFPLEGSLLTNSGFVAQTISAFTAIVTEPTNTLVKYAVSQNATVKWWNGSAWVDSNSTAAEANTLAEIQANIDSLLSLNSTVKLLVILTTTDQSVTPEIDLASFTYDFGAVEPGSPTQARVFGFLKDSEGLPVVGAVIKVVPNRTLDQYIEASNRIITKVSQRTTDANGFFAFNLIISDDYEVTGAQKMRYKLTIEPVGAALPIFKNGTNDILFEVPNQPEVNITDQIGAI